MARTKRQWDKALHNNDHKKQDGIKHYIPNGDLVNFLGEQLHRRKEIEAGREPPEDDKGKRNNRIDRLKFHYLDKIFKAMADLSFFFEAIARHPELEKIYEDDVRDLLGIRRKKPSDKSGFMFYNLLYYILKVSGSPFERREIVKDFRLILTHCAEEIVMMKVRRSLPSGQYSRGGMLEVNSNEANLHGLILDNFARALTYTWMLASDVYKSQDVEDEPHRTFDFDTEKLLGIKKEKSGESS